MINKEKHRETQSSMRQKNIIKAWILFCIAFSVFMWLASSSFSGEQTSTAQEIIINAIKAIGGEQLLREEENKNNYSLDASIFSDSGEYIGTCTYHFKKPAKVKSDIYLLPQNLFITEIYNEGKIYLALNGKIIDKDTEMAREFKRGAELRSRLGWLAALYLLDHSNEVEYIGEKTIQEKKCIGLGIVIEKNIKAQYFFDPETYFIAATTIYWTAQNIESTTYYGDFQIKDGRIYPFRKETYKNGSKISEMKIREISFDELDDSLFEIPEGK